MKDKPYTMEKNTVIELQTEVIDWYASMVLVMEETLAHPYQHRYRPNKFQLNIKEKKVNSSD